MARTLYHVHPETGHLSQYSGGAWSEVIASTPAGWLADNASEDRASSNGIFVQFKAVPYVRYLSATHAIMLPISNLQDGTPAYNAGAAVSVATGGGAEAWSNTISYRGKLVWLGWASADAKVTCYTFDGTTLTRLAVTQNALAAKWSDAYAKVSPQVGGVLFAFADQLFFGPGGTFGENPTSNHNHIFKISIESASATYSLFDVGFNTAEQYQLQNPWAVDAEAPTTLGVYNGFKRAVLAAGAHEGKLYVLNADGRLDEMDPNTGARTNRLDIRSADSMLAKQLLAVKASEHGQSFRALTKEAIAGDSGGFLPFLGGRVDRWLNGSVSDSGTLRAMWEDEDGEAEFGVQSMDGQNNFPALPDATRIDIRFGLCGTIRRDNADLWNEGGSCSALILTSKYGMFIITGVNGPRDAQFNLDTHAPLLVTRWSGNVEDAPVFLPIRNNGAQADVAGLSAYVDEAHGLLNILWGDTQTETVQHVQVRISSMTQTPAKTVHSLSDGLFPGAVKPGSAAVYDIETAEVVVDSVSFEPEALKTRVDYTLYTLDEGLTTDLVVEYNNGGDWAEATGADSDERHEGVDDLSASANGDTHVFIHDTSIQLAGYVGPVQYRLRTIS
jgi:hypothetical protein